MIVVADSSPLIALINIEQVNCLATLFGEILIPPAVADELQLEARPEAVRKFLQAPPAWLKVQAPTNVEAIDDIHLGETEAISLAREIGAVLLLVDDAVARRAAVERGLAIAGVVGVLERAATEGLLNLRDSFERLRRTDFWISPHLLDARLRRFEQQSPP